MKVNENRGYRNIGNVITTTNDRQKTRAYIPKASFFRGKGANEKNLVINLFGNVSGYFPRYVALQRVNNKLYIFPNVHGYAMTINTSNKGEEHAMLTIPFEKDEGLREWDGLLFDSSDTYYGIIHYDTAMYKYYIDMKDAIGYQDRGHYQEAYPESISPEKWNRIIAILEEE